MPVVCTGVRDGGPVPCRGGPEGDAEDGDGDGDG